ncbi:hypothetical protein D1872_324530 [compost metagenome]
MNVVDGQSDPGYVQHTSDYARNVFLMKMMQKLRTGHNIGTAFVQLENVMLPDPDPRFIGE